MKIYNPTYGALFEFDEAKPADPKEIGAWQLSYASPERGLTSNEIQKLLSNGKIGSYPDEFHLVGSEQWPLSRVQTHQRAVKAFEAVNREGPRFAHRDKLGNMRERIVVNFVSGPIVDLILASKSVEEAASKVYEMILSDVAAQFRKLKSFQAMAQTHARNLAEVVRRSVAEHEEAVKPVREYILEFLLNATEALPPVEIARGCRLNHNTVRRELQDMLKRGFVVKQGHRYSISK